MFRDSSHAGVDEEEREGVLAVQEAMRGVQAIEANLYVSRKPRTQRKHEVEVCTCVKDSIDEGRACDGPECLNFATCIECTPGECPCGEYCCNQRFQRGERARFRVFRTRNKGWGLKALESIEADRFVTEFVGEVIDDETFERRRDNCRKAGREHMFFQRFQAGEYLDATFKGSISRFINHSCEPNCRMDVWVVGVERRVGIFANSHVDAGQELTIDYQWALARAQRSLTRCMCDAPSCRGFLECDVVGWGEPASGDNGAALIGRCIRVFWKSEEPPRFFKALVENYDTTTQQHGLLYVNLGLRCDENLAQERWELLRDREAEAEACAAVDAMEAEAAAACKAEELDAEAEREEAPAEAEPNGSEADTDANAELEGSTSTGLHCGPEVADTDPESDACATAAQTGTKAKHKGGSSSPGSNDVTAVKPARVQRGLQQHTKRKSVGVLKRSHSSSTKDAAGEAMGPKRRRTNTELEQRPQWMLLSNLPTTMTDEELCQLIDPVGANKLFACRLPNQLKMMLCFPSVTAAQRAQQVLSTRIVQDRRLRAHLVNKHTKSILKKFRPLRSSDNASTKVENVRSQSEAGDIVQQSVSHGMTELAVKRLLHDTVDLIFLSGSSEKLDYPRRVLARAAINLQRFFAERSLLRYDRSAVAAACLWTAVKLWLIDEGDEAGGFDSILLAMLATLRQMRGSNEAIVTAGEEVAAFRSKVLVAERELLLVTGCALAIPDPFEVMRSMTRLMDHDKSTATYAQALIQRADALLLVALRSSVWGTYAVPAVACTILHITAAAQLLETLDSRSAALLSARPPIIVPEVVKTRTVDSVAVTLIPQLYERSSAQQVDQDMQILGVMEVVATWIVHVEHQQLLTDDVRRSKSGALRYAPQIMVEQIARSHDFIFMQCKGPGLWTARHKLLDDAQQVLLQCLLPEGNNENCGGVPLQALKKLQELLKHEERPCRDAGQLIGAMLPDIEKCMTSATLDSKPYAVWSLKNHG